MLYKMDSDDVKSLYLKAQKATTGGSESEDFQSKKKIFQDGLLPKFDGIRALCIF